MVVDDESLAVFGQWPWPRTRLAELTNKLGELGAAAILYDFIFAEPDRMTSKMSWDRYQTEGTTNSRGPWRRHWRWRR